MSGDGNGAGASRTIGASEFKVKYLELIEQVAEGGGEIVITKDGRPVSRLVPYREQQNLSFGRHRDQTGTPGDIGSPMPSAWFQDPDDSDAELF